LGFGFFMSEIFDLLGPWAMVDILIIAFVIYHMLLLIRGTRTAQVLTGILIIGMAAFVLSLFVPLTTVNWMMNKFYSSFIIIIVILFQDDIRRVLSNIGKKPFVPGGDVATSHHLLEEITRAATVLASKRIGALIVVERNIILNRYIEIGVSMDAKVSMELLQAVFHPSSPIHDGAIIIQHGRIAAAGCFLPLAREEKLDQAFGTRHRAAIGITQETDAVVVLVSEERGSVALVFDGKISRSLDAKELRKGLKALVTGVSHRAEGGDASAVSPDQAGLNWLARIFRWGAER
jgi:diadenylate cyclase